MATRVSQPWGKTGSRRFRTERPQRNQPFAAVGSDWLASGKSDHAPEIVIPQRVAQRGDGCAQRQDRHGFHAANRVMAILEPIIRNARIEVMDMMEADIS